MTLAAIPTDNAASTAPSSSIWPTVRQLSNVVFPLVALVEPELIVPKVAFDVLSYLYRRGGQQSGTRTDSADA